MKLYRLTQKKFSDEPFSPVGAKLFGGRWNSKGVEALYFSESESLCALEVFVHVNKDLQIINRYQLYRVDVPESLIAKLEHTDLPNNWRAIPAGEATQAIGDEFLASTASPFVALQVPSVISPRDYNYLFNPNHPQSSAILEHYEALDFAFDPRIFK